MINGCNMIARCNFFQTSDLKISLFLISLHWLVTNGYWFIRASILMCITQIFSNFFQTNELTSKQWAAFDQTNNSISKCLNSCLSLFALISAGHFHSKTPKSVLKCKCSIRTWRWMCLIFRHTFWALQWFVYFRLLCRLYPLNCN